MTYKTGQEGMKAKPSGLEAPKRPYDESTLCTKLGAGKTAEAPNYRDAGFIIFEHKEVCTEFAGGVTKNKGVGGYKYNMTAGDQSSIVGLFSSRRFYDPSRRFL